MPINVPDRQQLDMILRETLLGVRTALENAGELKTQLDQVTDAQLQAAGGGFEYTAQDVTNLRAALTAMDDLRQIANGQKTQAATNDFWFHAKRIWGISRIRR